MLGQSAEFFTEQRWEAIRPSIEALAKHGPKGDLRRFVEGVFWILRSGAPWRDLPTRFGGWQRVYRRYRRWSLAGRWERMRQTSMRPKWSASDVLLIDSTIVKAHGHAAGALRRLGPQALGRSRGGFTSKVHALVTSEGHLVRCVLTGGERHDVTQAKALVRHRAEAVVGDRAYDSDAFLTHVESLGMRAVVPSRRTRRVTRSLDARAYRQRSTVERWFGRIKLFRRIATRYEKTAMSYLGFVALAAWLMALTSWK